MIAYQRLTSRAVTGGTVVTVRLIANNGATETQDFFVPTGGDSARISNTAALHHDSEQPTGIITTIVPPIDTVPVRAA